MKKAENMYVLQVESEFASAHQLREYQGKCENLHGHNWRVLARVQGGELDATGMLMDFGILKQHLRALTEELDHKFLNATPPFDTLNPTSENLAKYLYERLSLLLPSGVAPQSVTVYESPTSSATFSLS